MAKNTKADDFIKKSRNKYFPLAWLNLGADMDFLFGELTDVANESTGLSVKGIAAGDEELLGRFLEAATKAFSKEEEASLESSVKEELLALRETIVGRVDSLTGYVCELAIYEDMLKRLRSSFQTDSEPVDVEEAAREILQGVFASEDPMVTNLRLQHMISCLPVRMTKNRFYDLLTQNVARYVDSDPTALEAFRYRVLSAAALRPVAAFDCYAELNGALAELRGLEPNALYEADCDTYLERLEGYGDALVLEQEFLECLVRCVNNLLTIVLLRGEELSTDSTKTAETFLPVVEGFLSAFGEYVAGRTAEMDEELLTTAYSAVEGRMERLSEEIGGLESAFQALCEQDEEWAAGETAKGISLVMKLMSTSDYAELADSEPREPLTKAEVETATKELLEAFEQCFEGKNRRFVRSVMCFVLRELPVFFDSRTDAMNYVLQALQSCKSNAEKRLAVDEVKELFEELPW